jgi:hypothetical protein
MQEVLVSFVPKFPGCSQSALAAFQILDDGSGGPNRLHRWTDKGYEASLALLEEELEARPQPLIQMHRAQMQAGGHSGFEPALS